MQMSAEYVIRNKKYVFWPKKIDFIRIDVMYSRWGELGYYIKTSQGRIKNMSNNIIQHNEAFIEHDLCD